MQTHLLMNGNQTMPDALSIRKNAFFTTLVVDGPIPFASFLKEFFKTEGQFIIRAGSAEEALAKTRHFLPDLILLNSELEGIPGLSLLPGLLLEHPHAAVIIMASKPNAPEAVEAMKMGATDYLERPLDQKKLKQAIDLQKSLFKTP
jgi:DNA-binding NtrC family response regulator